MWTTHRPEELNVTIVVTSVDDVNNIAKLGAFELVGVLWEADVSAVEFVIRHGQRWTSSSNDETKTLKLGPKVLTMKIALKK